MIRGRLLLETYLLQDPGGLAVFGLVISHHTLRGLRDGRVWEACHWIDLGSVETKHTLEKLENPIFTFIKVVRGGVLEAHSSVVVKT